MKKKLITRAMFEHIYRMMHDLEISHQKLSKEVIALQSFMMGTQVHICKDMKDLHSRLEYIKTYVGRDEFFEALKGEE